jgi:alpha-D-ribose 1-methylphosphonate 5-triphosphate synthase subunit PhnG
VEELRRKRDQRASLGRQIVQLRKSLKGSQVNWTERERSRQQADLDALLQDAARLDREMAILKQHIRLHKVKLLLIKL